MSGYTMQRETTYHLNESFKALLASAFSNPQQSEVFIKAFEEVVNDRATTQAIRLDRLKDEAIQEIRNELLTKDVFYTELKATKEVLQSELKAIEAKLESEIAKIKTEIANVRTELKQEIADVRTELKQEIADVRTELKQEIADVRTKLETETAKIRTEIAEVKTNTIRWVVGVGITATIVSITANFALISFLIDKLMK